MKICNSILEAIGNTPMVRLNRVTEGIDANILVKCEFMNPSGSIKDRMALRMIEEAEKSGKLKPDGIIIDGSTGNTAIALAFLAAAKGYKAIIFMPEGYVNQDRLNIVRAYGAELEQVDIGEELLKELEGRGIHGGVVERMPRIKCAALEKSNPKVWWARQSENPDNINAHRDSTAKEIIEQTDGKIDVFVAAMGTAGTLCGVSEALKAINPSVKIYGVEPEGWSLLSPSPIVQEYMEKYQIPVPIETIQEQLAKSARVDEVFQVKDEDALTMMHRLAEEEGLFCGGSSGANVCVALQVARKYGKGQNIVTVLPDARYRYFTEPHFVT